MKLTIFLITSFLFIGLQWEVFTSEEGRFSILSPKVLEKSEQDIPTEIGKLTYHTYSCNFMQDTSSNVLGYVISYCDFPEGSIPQDSTELVNAYFEESIESIRQNLDAELIYNESISLKGNKGMLARLAYANGEQQMKTKIFLVGNRFYSLQVYMLSSLSMKRDADKFLDSFILL